ncbi:MAG TPA: hypothetical protein VGF45_06925, partial [Polyangia bacterium]
MASPSTAEAVATAAPAPSRGAGRRLIVQMLAKNREEFLEFLARRLGSRDVADELLQDAFVTGIARAG